MNNALMSVFTSLWLFSGGASAQFRESPSPAGTASGQPNLAVSPDGRVHLSWIERLGEGRFSLRFTTRINSEPGSALAVWTIRAARLAVGKNGRVHVAWNGRHDPGGHDAPMLYARRNYKKA